MGYDGVDDTVIRAPAHVRSTSPTPGSAVSGPDDDEVLEGDTIISARRVPRPDPERPPAGGRLAEAPMTSATRYRLRVNGDQPVELDRTTIVGRRPGATRIPGRHDPRLITVESPQHEVSSNHIEIAQEGASVVVTDLRSTNGTTVTLPSSERVRLRPGESFVAVPGSMIDIGDGNVMEILTVERLLPADGWTT